MSAKGIAAAQAWRKAHPARFRELNREAHAFSWATNPTRREHLARVRAIGTASMRRAIDWSFVKALRSQGLSWRRCAHALAIPPATDSHRAQTAPLKVRPGAWLVTNRMVAECREEMTAFWHAVACGTGPRKFRAAYLANPRAALLHVFSIDVLPRYRARRDEIRRWLESTDELPAELASWDPTNGFNGHCMGDSGKSGAFVVGGDPACCDADPDYVWDPAIRESLLAVDSVRDQLSMQGWSVAPLAVCSSHHPITERLAG